MKNPLYKRIPRELKHNLGKHLALFLFLTLTIGFCSGYFVATGSLSARLAENYDSFSTEDGHFVLDREIDEAITKTVQEHDVQLIPLFYKDKTLPNGHVFRIYPVRTQVNRMTMYSGREPQQDHEIAIDRLYAQNNQIRIGDEITLEGKNYSVTGFSVVPDYTSLYRNNTDFMFNVLEFNVAFVTAPAFDAMNDNGIVYNYAWMYHDRTLSEEQKHEKADKLMNAIAETIRSETEDRQKARLQTNGSSAADASALPMLKDFISSDANSAINMATEDVGNDKVLVMWLLYITIGVIAMAAAITSKSTVEKEANVIGTLRASGYRRGELIGHYMILTVLMTLLAALIGNVIGYSFMNSICASLYYGSYSFPVYTPRFNMEAFLLTTLVPVGIVLSVHFLVLMRMLALPPLQFLRGELKKKKKTRNFRLSLGSFSTRFRLRVILRNRQAYLVLFVGILFSNLLLMFSLMWTPLLKTYRTTVMDHVIAENQILLKTPVETAEPTAEKFAVYTLKNDNGEDITIYGISESSRYVKDLDFSGNKVYFSSAYGEKYGVKDGQEIHFSEKFSSREYKFVCTALYHYPPSLCVFMGLDHFREVFGTEDGYFSGYFCNQKIADVDDSAIATVITRSDLTKTADQLENSVGFVKLFSLFAVAIYILMIYILSKMITERNARSVSVLKILGYHPSEISNLYNLSTGIVVLVSMLISLPLNYLLIRVFYQVMMRDFNGWLSFCLSPEVYFEMVATGCLCFLAAYLLEMRRVRKIPMNEAIKNME